MASVTKTAEKRVRAIQTIGEASARLASQLNIEIAPMPDVRRYDPEFGRAMQLEHFGETLKQISDALEAENAPIEDVPIVEESVANSKATKGGKGTAKK